MQSQRSEMRDRLRFLASTFTRTGYMNCLIREGDTRADAKARTDEHIAVALADGLIERSGTVNGYRVLGSVRFSLDAEPAATDVAAPNGEEPPRKLELLHEGLWYPVQRVDNGHGAAPSYCAIVPAGRDGVEVHEPQIAENVLKGVARWVPAARALAPGSVEPLDAPDVSLRGILDARDVEAALYRSYQEAKQDRALAEERFTEQYGPVLEQGSRAFSLSDGRTVMVKVPNEWWETGIFVKEVGTADATAGLFPQDAEGCE